MPKIIVLYILKQVTKTILFTFLIIFGILFLNESIQFLEKASRGELYPSLLVLVLFYSLPTILEVSIPISVFLGVLISMIFELKPPMIKALFTASAPFKEISLSFEYPPQLTPILKDSIFIINF